jgi:hypothetical protein
MNINLFREVYDMNIGVLLFQCYIYFNSIFSVFSVPSITWRHNNLKKKMLYIENDVGALFHVEIKCNDTYILSRVLSLYILEQFIFLMFFRFSKKHRCFKCVLFYFFVFFFRFKFKCTAQEHERKKN